MATWVAGLLWYSTEGAGVEEAVLAEALHVFGDRLGGEPETARKVEDAVRRVLQEKLGWSEDASDAVFCTLGKDAA